jgi:nitrite reductase/ring-hydroxylating ferredoxin subunit
MKKIIIVFYLLFFMLSCDKSKDAITPTSNNPFLPNYSFTINVDLSLPSNSQLTFAGNGIRILQSGVGIRGIFVFNTGSSYTAFDLACPNQDLATCSTMTLNGINGVCPCDSANYSLYTGQAPGKQYPLKQYRTEVNGGVVRVFN